MLLDDIRNNTTYEDLLRGKLSVPESDLGVFKYIAGVIDSVGLFVFDVNKKYKHGVRLCLVVKSKHNELVSFLKSNVGGSILEDNGRYVWTLGESDTVDLLNIIYPYLRVRIYNADTFIQVSKLKHTMQTPMMIEALVSKVKSGRPDNGVI